MKTERDTLRRISELQAPRHLIVLPKWVDPKALDRLIDEGHLAFTHLQRAQGVIKLAMGLQLTNKGTKWLRSRIEWPELALRGSLAGICLTLLSVALLYLA